MFSFFNHSITPILYFFYLKWKEMNYFHFNNQLATLLVKTLPFFNRLFASFAFFRYVKLFLFLLLDFLLSMNLNYLKEMIVQYIQWHFSVTSWHERLYIYVCMCVSVCIWICLAVEVYVEFWWVWFRFRHLKVFFKLLLSGLE